MPESHSTAGEGSVRSDFWREMLIAFVMGSAALASAWSSYQSVLWGGIQTFRLADLNAVGRTISVKEVTLGHRHLVDVFLLERFLHEQEAGNVRIANFLLARMTPEVRAATEAWLKTRPLENPDAARSPFHLDGFAQGGVGVLEELLRKQAVTYAEADRANKISDKYVRFTVFFGLAMFLAGICAVTKSLWPRRVLLVSSVAIVATTIALLARMPLAAE